MFKLARFLKPYKKQVIAGPIFKLIEAVFELIVPLVMANIIDIGVKNNDGPYIWRMGGLLLLLGVVGLCSTLVCQYFASIASQGFGTELRNKLFRHINTFSYAEVDKFGTPSLITRLTNDVFDLPGKSKRRAGDPGLQQAGKREGAVPAGQRRPI